MVCPLVIGISRRLLPRPRRAASAGILGTKPKDAFKQRQPVLLAQLFCSIGVRRPLHACAFGGNRYNGPAQLGLDAKPEFFLGKAAGINAGQIGVHSYFYAK